jgi:hypothetical protein
MGLGGKWREKGGHEGKWGGEEKECKRIRAHESNRG